jgi:hypothetical protein
MPIVVIFILDAPLIRSGWSCTFHSGTLDAVLNGGVHSIAYNAPYPNAVAYKPPRIGIREKRKEMSLRATEDISERNTDEVNKWIQAPSIISQPSCALSYAG